MAKVIFDIETIGRDFESFDEKQQEYLLKFAEGDEEREETKQKLALWGVTGEAVAIGMLNPETGKSVVYYRNRDKKEIEKLSLRRGSALLTTGGSVQGNKEIEDADDNLIISRMSSNISNVDDLSNSDIRHQALSDGVNTVANDSVFRCDSKQARRTTGNVNDSEGQVYVEVGSEREILEKFWEDIKKFRQFITFNGRAFDCPFLILRSGVLGVKPSRNLMTHRYESEIHVDLLELLTFHGAVRKFNLDFYAKIFGIESPKTMMNGLEIKKMFMAGKGLEIAKYCYGDLAATEKLWERWRDFMRGNSL